MADIALDINGDLDLTGNTLSIVSGTAAIVQQLTIRLRFFLGEWFLDRRVGIPYYDKVLIKNPDLVEVRGIMRQAILTTPGVQSIQRFDLSVDRPTRTMTIQFNVLTTTGEIIDFDREFILI